MKNLTILMLCICSLFCFHPTKAQSNAATLYVTADENTKYVTVFISDRYGINPKKDTIRLTAGTTQTYKVPLTQAQQVVLGYGKNGRSDLWLKPGGMLTITLRNDTPEFSGSLAPFARYYAADSDFWKKIYKDYATRNPQFDKDPNSFTDNYFIIQDSIYADRVNYLTNYFKQGTGKDNADFVEHQKAAFYYSNLYYKMTFTGSDYEKFTFIQKRYKIDRPYHYQYSEVVEFNNDKLLSNSYYRAFFSFLVAEMARKSVKNSGEKFAFDKYLTICMSKIDELVTTQSIKNNFRAVFLDRMGIDVQINKDAKMGGIISNTIDAFLKTGKNTALEMVKEKIEKIVKDVRFVKGAPAPAFILKDPFGKTYTLNDFKGKKLIFDMSASWCGPCIAALPDWNKLAALNSDNKDVVFISLSLDKSEAEWGAFIKEHPTEGLHLYAGDGFKSKFALDYEIMAIPHYLLIDQNGNIALYNAENINNEAVSKFLKQ